ncbi:MAG: glycosyltransferase family 2 protein [Anaerolineales bacterium]|nr:glycosyltransferase family 2 protein [Anaerolineales bacterium]
MSDSLAVVVLTFNAKDFIDPCLASALAQTLPVQVVVADNGSQDGTLAHVRERWPAVTALDLGANHGFAGGYNRVLATVEAEWLVLLNPDATLAPDWCEQLLAFAATQPAAAVLGGALLFSHAAGSAETVQSIGSRFTDAGTAFEVGWGQPLAEQPPARMAPHRTAAIPGAALLIRRRTFWDLGGFDPGYFAYLEDVDLCWRAWLAGHEVWVVPQAQALHAFGASSGGRISPFRIRCMQRNRYANMARLLEAGTLIIGLATSIGYDGYRMLEYAGHRRWDGLQALWLGTLDAARRLPGWWRARHKIQAGRRRTDRDLRRIGLLVSALAGLHEYRRLQALAVRGETRQNNDTRR